MVWIFPSCIKADKLTAWYWFSGGLIKKHMVSISKNIDLMNKTLLYTIYHKKYSMFNNNLNLFYFLQILHKK